MKLNRVIEADRPLGSQLLLIPCTEQSPSAAIHLQMSRGYASYFRQLAKQQHKKDRFVQFRRGIRFVGCTLRLRNYLCQQRGRQTHRFEDFQRQMAECDQVFAAWNFEYNMLHGVLRDVRKLKRSSAARPIAAPTLTLACRRRTASWTIVVMI